MSFYCQYTQENKSQTVIYFTMFLVKASYTECMLNEATHKTLKHCFFIKNLAPFNDKVFIMKTLSTAVLIALLSTSAFASNGQSNTAIQGATNSNVQQGAGNVSVITSAQNQVQLNDALSAGAGVNVQTNAAQQAAANLNTQEGYSNVSVIENAQTSGQANAAVALPKPYKMPVLPVH